ncbi:MAG: hypothetical protein HY606_12080 [Planctomycetes bacterium]|nr:hypothetical protein [Planctomycetota bacterium]
MGTAVTPLPDNPANFSADTGNLLLHFCPPSGAGNDSKPSKKLKNKPLYIALGDQEIENVRKTIDKFVEDLKNKGTKVKYDIYKDQGHQLEIKSKLLFDWMDSVLKDIEKAVDDTRKKNK